MADASPSPESPRSGNVWITLVVCALLALATFGMVWWILNTQPEAERTTETRESAMLVEVVDVQRGTYRPRIRSLGRVQPARRIELSPRIDGQVVARSEDFNPGGFLEAGEVVVEIDAADYRNTLAERKSALQQAEAELALEMGRQQIAETELALLADLDNSVNTKDRGLVLREPQKQVAEARVAAARAAMEQAQLQLDRTRVTAPFRAQVLDRQVDVGSQVAAGDSLGTLVGIDTYWVIVTVPLKALPWIELTSGNGDDGALVSLRHAAAWPQGATREGRVQRLIGALNRETRLARLLVIVKDPLSLEADNDGVPTLLLDSLLESTITGREISDVVRLERALLRANDTVWVMDEENQLRVMDVEVVFEDATHAYVSAGLEDGDRVVTTNLATVSDGAPLRVEGAAE